MMAELNDGSVVELPKDCGCITHEGPHWLHANDLWRDRNRSLMGTARAPSADPARRMLAMQGLAREEMARLAEKGRLFERHGIARLIRAADQND